MSNQESPPPFMPDRPVEEKEIDVALEPEMYDIESLFHDLTEEYLSESGRETINDVIVSADHEIQVEELSKSTISEARRLLFECGYEDVVALVSPQKYEIAGETVRGVDVFAYESVPDSVLIVMANRPRLTYLPSDSIVVCTAGW